MALSFKELDNYNEKVWALKPTQPYRIIVIGCGGTGAHLIPDLVRAAAFAPSPIELIFVDGDRVEAKNITRQNFISKDQGKNKAAIMAQRYGQAFGMEISYLDRYLERVKDLTDILDKDRKLPLRDLYSYRSGGQLIISCVDNNETRRLIHKVSVSSVTNNTGWWLDSGNETDFGQVILSFFSRGQQTDGNYRQEEIIQTVDAIRRGYGTGKLGWLPQITEIFPQILEAKGSAKPDVSCVEQAEADPQNILINRLAAANLLSYTYKFIYPQPIHTYMIHFTSNGETRGKSITLTNMLEIWKKAYPNNEEIQNL